MKALVAIAIALGMVLSISGVALARWGGPGMGGPCMGAGVQGGAEGQGPAWGPGAGRGMMGRGFRGPGATASGQIIDEAKAKEIASEYVTKSLPGYKVEKLTAFQMPRGPMYQVELKGPQNEVRYLHINPWGAVRDFPARAF